MKNSFERRLGLWPTYFDQDGILYTNTAYGDYPHYMPTKKVDKPSELFTGWMLLNYNKPVKVSSTLGSFQPNFAVDEDIKTYWSAKTGGANEYIQTDLGERSLVKAIQINFADQDAEFLGKTLGKSHQYKIYASDDEKNWKLVVDKSNN